MRHKQHSIASPHAHAAEALAQRGALASDPHRPRYHFVAPRNWLNDPNGLIHWKGTYHLFYQHNPHGPLWGGIHWGHATSDDLVHWTDQPIALAPTPGGPDTEGCWSGCAMVDDGVPSFLYTGFRDGAPSILLARALDDELLRWEKYEHNPVIASPPEGMEVTGFRDHSVWREGETWYQLIGSGIRGEGGAALLYRSPDLIDWEYLHPLLVGDGEGREALWTGSMWECPDFFPLDGEHVLIFSVWHENTLNYTVAMVGAYEGQRFAPRALHKLDYGDHHFYAPQSLRDERGRRLIWGWIQEGRSAMRQSQAGWSGVMSLPRELSIGEDGNVRMTPVPELQRLRGAHRRYEGIDVRPDGAPLLAGLGGHCVELVAEFEVGEAQQVGLTVRRAPDGSEETLIYYDAVTGQLVLDSERSTLDSQCERRRFAGEHGLLDGVLRLRLFLDHSVIEIFTDGPACLTGRLYPTRADSLGIDLFATGGTARLRSLDVWEMASIWPTG